jgi:hypothetical protein
MARLRVGFRKGSAGRYRTNPDTLETRRVGNPVGHYAIDSVSVPNPYYSQNLGCFISSKRQKRDLLKRRGLVEIGDARVRDMVPSKEEADPMTGMSVSDAVKIIEVESRDDLERYRRGRT